MPEPRVVSRREKAPGQPPSGLAFTVSRSRYWPVRPVKPPIEVEIAHTVLPVENRIAAPRSSCARHQDSCLSISDWVRAYGRLVQLAVNPLERESLKNKNAATTETFRSPCGVGNNQHNWSGHIESQRPQINKAARHPVSGLTVANVRALPAGHGRNIITTVKADSQAERWVRPPIQQEGSESALPR